MHPLRRVLLPALLAFTVPAAAPRISPPDGARSPGPCDDSAGSRLAPSRDLYCIELTPVPELEQVTSTVELNRVATPFGVNVTRDGAPVYAPLLTIQGLPAPNAFHPGARHWVVWLATPDFRLLRRLGEARNGESALPAIDWPKFLVLVTAEIRTDGVEPEGRVALRGFSASSRMQPPDMMEFLYGTPPAGDSAPAGAAAPPPDHGRHAAEAPPSGITVWVHPPMPPGLAMMPAEMRLGPPAVSPFLPAGGDGIPDARPRELVRLQDGDSILLTAGPVRQRVGDHTFVGYGYNGQVPGPLLWAPRGATVHVRYRSAIDWPSTVHWHGVRLDNRSDGVPGLTQDAVPPGGTFDYDVRVPDTGLYWYHPHLREDVLKDLGLFGNLMVRAPAEEYGPAHREEVLMLDDLEVAEAGLVPWGRERATHALMGRFGNVFLVNGRADWSLTVRRGEVVRFFLTNVTNARTFNVSFGGARIKVVGSDVGLYEREEWVESVVVSPAERYIVHVRFAEPGSVALENRVTALDHTFGRFITQVDTFGIVRVGEEPAHPEHASSFAALQEHTGVVADIDRYRDRFDRSPDRELVVRMEADGLPFVVDRFLRFDSVYFHPVEWSGTMPMMNWIATPREVRWILEEPSTGRRNMDIRWDFRIGDLVKIRIANLRETLHGMQHPLHFHGQRFLVLSQNGVPNTNLVWKDTFLLPAGGSADILLEISNPGKWMAHCHISEHLESGMMLTFTAR